jgi:hypothetical protein
VRGHLLLWFLLFSFSCKSQTLNDAILFGQDHRIGNARFTAMSGSFGALGGNSSATTLNAASIGVYRKGAGSASLGMSSQGLNTTHYGSTTSEYLTSGTLTNLALVFSNELYDNDWMRFNVMFSYNRRNNFDSQNTIRGINSESSKLDRYLDDILEEPVYIEDLYEIFPFGAGMAWGAELIDTVDGKYYHQLESYGEEQQLHTKIRGGIGDYYAGFGANYEDKIYFGASLGISSINYSLESTYTETPEESNVNTFLTSWSESTTLNISGRGLKLGLGVIYWIQEKNRIGFSFNSGTRYMINEGYKKTMVANWKDKDQTFANSPEGVNEYEYVSPYNITISYGLVDKYIGSLNVDAEWVAYGRMKFNKVAGFPVDFSGVNNGIGNSVGPTLNLRLGGELLLGSFLFRGGGALYGNPVKGKEYFNRYSISGGIGYRIKRATFDIAYSYLVSSSYETNIHFAEGIRLQPSTVDLFSHQFVLTAGFKFNKLQ